MKFGKQEDGTWILREDRLIDLDAKVSKLVKRATKTGTAPLGVQVVDFGLHKYKETVEGGVEKTHVVPWARVKITGESPVIAGFTFVARVEHHDDIGNIVSRAPGAESVEIPKSYRDAHAYCEHCAVKRRRNDTFLLRSEFGTLHQIGRNCLADFVRTSDVGAALGMWRLLVQIQNLLGSMDDYESGYGGSPGYTSTLSFVAAACSTIRRDGWLGMKVAREQNRVHAASASIAEYISGAPPKDAKAHEDWLNAQPEEEDFELAQDVVGWAQELGEREDLSDYLHNVRVAVALGYVTRKTRGLVASAVPAYKRELALDFAKQKQAAKGPGKYLGAIKQRLNFTLTVMHATTREGDYGVKTIVGFEDGEGNLLVWFATGYQDLKPGDQVSGKATVMKHGEFNGRHQTVIARFSYTKQAKQELVAC